MFMDNFTTKYTENLVHAHAVDTRPGDEAKGGCTCKNCNFHKYMYMNT